MEAAGKGGFAAATVGVAVVKKKEVLQGREGERERGVAGFGEVAG